MQFIPFMAGVLTLGLVLVVLAIVNAIYTHISIKNDQKALQELRQKTFEAEQAQARQHIELAELLKDEVATLIAHHKKTLVRKANQTIYTNDYGNDVFDKWFSERDYFIENVLLMQSPTLLSYVDREWIQNAVSETALAPNPEGGSMPPSLSDGISPIEFEHFCAQLLRSAGWEARVTTATGDQGIDIIGICNGLKAVFQCKLYSNPVGNSAVQEVIAGREYEGAALAAVISNSTFTPAARQLASVAGVTLLHFSEVPDFASALLASNTESNF